MQPSDNQFDDLMHWWRASRAAFDEVERRQLEPLLHTVQDEGMACREMLLPSLGMLVQLGADAELVAIALGYCCPDLSLDADIAARVQALREIDRLEDKFDPSQGVDAEGLRRLLLAIVDDVRVVLVVLVDRLVSLRQRAGDNDEHTQLQARRSEILHIPLANRLGIWQLKWELEDLVFRCLQPETYKRIASMLDERRSDREQYIGALLAELRQMLDAEGIAGEIRGRPKHIFSIWKKMQRKSLSFDQLFDLRAVRVLVDELRDCYNVLGLVHARWQPVPGEFDDYIANPKSNGYQSLHTAVFGPQGKTVEIQIRTRQMHEDAELGVAAHWRYKEGGAHDAAFQRKLNQMRSLLEGEDASEVVDEFLDEEEGRIYVLTPAGQVVELREGATPLDFAYQVHTELGHACRGAKVDGRIVPLTYTLSNGQQVEVMRGKEASPSRDWAVAGLGYLRSPRARAKVRQWFRRADYDRNVVDGREMIQRECRRLRLADPDFDALPKRFNRQSPEAVFAAVATGDLTVMQVVNALTDEPGSDPATLPLASRPRSQGKAGEIIIEGVGNLMTQISSCCKPLPGDRIVGFLTRQRGVSVHREDCPNVVRLLADAPERAMQVEWGSAAGAYQAELRIEAYNRSGLVRDITSLLVAEKIDLMALNSRVDAQRGEAQLELVVGVGDFAELSRLLSRLNAVPSVLEVSRVG